MKRLVQIGAVLVALRGMAAAAPPDAASFQRAMEQLKNYDYGQSEQPLHAIELYVVRYATNAARKAEVADRLAAILAEPNTSYAAKVFICQRLLIVGAEAQVPPLAKMLDDPQTAEIARYTLEGIPGETSLEALRGASRRFQGMSLVGVINSLGIRRDVKSVGELATLLGNADPLIAAAATEALGKIGSAKAAAVLLNAEVPAKALAALHNAQLQCAERLTLAGDTADAAAIYQQVWSCNQPWAWRLAGLAGLAKVDHEKATPAVLKAMASPDPLLQAAAVRLGAKLPGPQITATLVRQLDRLDATGRVLLLDVLAERGDRAAAAAVIRHMADQDEAVRVAAVRAMGPLGDVSLVDRLAGITTSAGAIQQAARESLVRLAGADVEVKLLALAAEGDAKARIEIFRILAARRAKGAGAVLLKATGDGDPQVRAAAWQSLAIAAQAQIYPMMVRRLAAATAADVDVAEGAVLAVGKRLANAAARVAPVAAARFEAAAPAKPALLRLLGGFGGPEALAPVRERLEDSDPAAREAAIRVLANWPDLSAADDLLKIAKTSQSMVHRRLAVRGYLRLTAQVKDAAQRQKLCEQVRSVAQTVEAKRMLLECLTEAADAWTLYVAAVMLDDAEVRPEAEVATLKIARGLVRLDVSAVRAAIKKLADTTKDNAVAEQAAAIDDEASKAPTPGGAERALEHDDKRSDAYKAALARRAPKGYRLACYLDCGPDTSDGVQGGPQLRLVNGVPWFWADSDRLADVRFGSVCFDGQRVVFRAAGLDPKKRYQIGFSWWDFDHDTRIQSVWFAAGNGGRETKLLDKTKLPSGLANQPPDIRTLAVPPALQADGSLQIIFRNESEPNVAVSEIWLWESVTDAGSKLRHAGIP
jgi:HEAT repeat protein